MGKPAGLRVLGRLRLSVSSDESTSIERQREIITSWAESNGHHIAGWAEDQDVSGSVDPFLTPHLGNWLNHRADEFDVIAVWKLDRISRSAIRLNHLIGWCLDHDKTLVSCSESIDISTPVGRLIANVIGFLAEGELEAMRERQRSSRRKLREAARWPGGKPPYGYRVVDNTGGVGKILEIDPHAYKVVRRIVDSVLDGHSIGSIVEELNNEGVPPPSDHHRIVNGGEDTGSVWRTWPMRHLLLSPTLVGHAHLGGMSIRDEQGNPVLMCNQPLVTDEERELIAIELAESATTKERDDPAALVGVLSCWFCETKLTSTKQTKTLASGEKRHYRYYRCPLNCTPLIPTETADDHVERLLLDALGDEYVHERVWVGGNNNEIALKEAIRAFDELTATAGTLTSTTAKDRLQRQLEAIDSRIAALEAEETRQGGYENRSTGITYRQAWQNSPDDEAKRILLRKVGLNVRIGVHEGQLLAHPITLGDQL